MSILATVPRADGGDPNHRPCDRCGLCRVTTSSRDRNLCASCVDTCTELGELEVWR